MEDQNTAAFFMPAPEEAAASPIDIDADGPPLVVPPPPPPVEDGYEFAGGPGDDGALVPESGEDVFGAAAVAEPRPVADDEVFFAGPPPVVDNDVDNNDDGINDDGMGIPADMDAVVPAETEDKEPSPMAKWNAEWQVTLKQRKDDEAAAKTAMAESAAKELEEFQAQREVKRDTKMARNRAEEQSKLEAMEADLENDNSWQRVIKLVEFQQDTEDKADDVTRMRDVMILLKNDQDKAAALS